RPLSSLFLLSFIAPPPAALSPLSLHDALPISRDALRTTWDAFVDELWADAPSHGAALLAAQFPRAYVDVNRAEDDLDPALLAEQIGRAHAELQSRENLVCRLLLEKKKARRQGR